MSKQAKIDEIVAYGWDDEDKVRASLDGARIIYVVYECEGSQSSAIVIFEKKGALFCVEASQCSCKSLDWGSPDATTREEILKSLYRTDREEIEAAWPEGAR